MVIVEVEAELTLKYDLNESSNLTFVIVCVFIIGFVTVFTSAWRVVRCFL